MSFIRKILSVKEEKLHVEYRHEFSSIESPQKEYSFPCNSDGILDHDNHDDNWIGNYKHCVTHPEKYKDKGIVERKMPYIKMFMYCAAVETKLFSMGIPDAIVDNYIMASDSH